MKWLFYFVSSAFFILTLNLTHLEFLHVHSAKLRYNTYSKRIAKCGINIYLIIHFFPAYLSPPTHTLICIPHLSDIDFPLFMRNSSSKSVPESRMTQYKWPLITFVVMLLLWHLALFVSKHFFLKVKIHK